MSFLELHKFEKYYGDLHAIKSIDLEVEQGEFIVFVGPSGCGKSTLLRMIAGLESIDGGYLYLDENDITETPAAKRDLAMVFQSYALYPHMSVKDNISFALRLAKVSPEIIEQKIIDVASKLDLTPYLTRKPAALSGGQRQRVAIGRAIVRSPKIFLFDEPLSNLDAALRGQTRLEIARLHRELGATTIYVTHDQIEAMTLADRVVVLNDGIIEQVGTPLELYDKPANLFVAQFIGMPKMNVLDAKQFKGQLENQSKEISFVAVRPEHIFITDSEDAKLGGTVELVESLGSETLIHLRLDGSGDASIIIRRYHRSQARLGDHIKIDWEEQNAHFFGADGKAVY